MELIANGINGKYLRAILENAPEDVEGVKAAIAYATSEELLDFCINRHIPLHFWGRMDESVPVSVPLLKRFLQAGPNYRCNLIFEHYHPKIIWFLNYGIYIGSANLTRNGWYSNIECGLWLTAAEINEQQLEGELTDIFDEINKNAEALTDELLTRISGFEGRSRANNAESLKLLRKDFEESFPAQVIKRFHGLAQVRSQTAIEKRRSRFLEEWSSTLQLLRKIAEMVSSEEFRPDWVSVDIPQGVQVDQFLHYYYYQTVKVGNRSQFEEFFLKNKTNPAAALEKALVWWRALREVPKSEHDMMYVRAPFLRDKLSQANIKTLSEKDFIEVCLRIHAFITAARQTTNEALELPERTKLDINERARKVAEALWQKQSNNGAGPLEVLNYVLYGGAIEDIPARIWEAAYKGEWHLRRLGLSCIGEIVGWAMPNRYPPRNGRTSKALRALGFDVNVYSE